MRSSTRRLLVAMATTVVVGTACSGHHPMPAESGRTMAASTTPAATPMTPPDSAAPWLTVARGFGHAFTATERGQHAWFTALSTWLTDAQADRYGGIPVDQIPAGRLTTVSVDEPLNGSTRGVLGYDTGMVLAVDLTFVDARGSWLVSSIIPQQPGDRSG